MNEKYTGTEQDRRYSGTDVDITYNVKRCIHAAECVNRLSEVFDTQKRPWINPDGASADEVASVVMQCPSGALHFERKDGGASEPLPDQNRIVVRHNGPLELRGNLAIQSTTVDLQQETRASLCRCGASANKPFCDNSHKSIGFEASEGIAVDREIELEHGEKLTVTVNPNGSIMIEGPMEIFDEDEQLLFSGNKTWLCRCGHSSKKPFCDGTHKRVSFEAE